VRKFTVLSNGKHQSPLQVPPVINPSDTEHDIFCSDQLFSTGMRVPFVALDGLFFFLILICEAIGTVATPGLLCQPRVTVKMIVEKQMECRLAGEIEDLRETLPQRHFCPSQNPT
jgi:hypothetical protein